MKKYGILAVAWIVACEADPPPKARPIGDVSREAREPQGAAQSRPNARGNDLETVAPNQHLLSGVVRVQAGIAVPKNATLFIVGRGASGASKKPSPPVLVKKIHPVKFPLDFALTGQNRMFQGLPVPYEMNVSARLDQDGDAISKSLGDLTGKLDGVKRGAKSLQLVLDTVVQVEKPSAPVQ